ncbi:MAG TPA: apolipoprotein N-acyltransferase [Terriglobales bacterium]|nr:apolipoprotein N-acyltransferase [Terriglobales bacterium]
MPEPAPAQAAATDAPAAARPAPLLAALLAAAASGMALAAVFPLLGWDWMAWFALAPLLIVVARADNWWRALAPGYVAGVVFFGFSCPWIATTIHNYGDLGRATSGLIFALFLLLMGSYLAIFAGLGYAIGRGLGHRLLPLPFLWVAVELLRTYTPMGGFPWNLLGSSQAAHAGFMLVAPVAGVYGASFLIALANTLLAGLLLRFYDERNAPTPRPWPTRRDGVLAAGLGLILAFATLPYHPPSLPVRTLRARLVQPNTPLEGSWSNARLQAFLDEQLRLSAPATGRAAALILWPEQPAPLDYALQTNFQAMTAELLSRTRATFVFGEVSYPLSALGAPEFDQPRNSVQVVHPDGTTGERYDKLHLVPFGEYVPLPGWLKRWAGVGKLVQEVGEFVPGKGPVLFTLNGRSFATLICYESIFPALARREVAMGAEWLVNQSDDGWYGASSAAAQGLQMAQVRAIENRRWLLRDTNDGITAVIDPYGRITAELPQHQAGELEASFSPLTELTFYTRHGDWLAYACCAMVALLALAALIHTRRHPWPSPPPHPSPSAGPDATS